MLSILIPVYNYRVSKLAMKLKRQCDKLGIVYQILVFDDGSKQKFKDENSQLGQEFGINYLEFSSNKGRAKIRNRLARTAMYDKILFLDCDSKLITAKFIKKYIEVIDQADVISGGRIYKKKAPRKDLMLHWKYGTERESLPPKIRNKNPFLNFHSNNFIISTSLFNEIQFDEKIQGYGYEDLLFAEKLKQADCTILHIDNPVEHTGLEKQAVFLEKTKNAIKNLVHLNLEGKLLDTRLTKFYQKMKSYGFLPTLNRFYGWREDQILNNIKSKSPTMRNFSLWKLMEYNKLLKEIENSE